MKRTLPIIIALATCSPLLGVAAVATVAHAADSPVATRTVTFDIAGMITKNCPVLVERAIRSIAGVKSVNADYEVRTAVVTYVAGKTTPDAIARIIEDRTGFRATARNE